MPIQRPHPPVRPSTRRTHRQRGQGMSEYIIITALIAVAGIGIFSAFGDTISSQAAAMAREMAGQDGSDQIDQADNNSQRAADRAGQEDTLQNFNEQN